MDPRTLVVFLCVAWGSGVVARGEVLGWQGSMAVAAIACAEPEKPKLVEPSASAPANECLEWKSPQGKPFWYRLPKSLSASKPATLLLMLHGTGMNQGWPFYNYPLVNSDWRKDDVIVAPEGMTPGDGGTFNFIQGPTDGDQIAGLIELLKKKLPIGRVYVYGHSQGAFFAYWFAGEHPELVDGIVAHAGNVLSVKHSKLSREKVAIGILHGRADAVVPVDCATRTEKIYRDEGYKKVKLLIVEGLNEKTGHWPLPKQVGEMLDWLDQVSTSSATQAVGVALDQLTRDASDLRVIRESVENAEKMLGKAKPDEKAALEPKLKALREFLEQAADAHAKALLADPAVSDPKLPYGPWVAHYRIAEAAFAPLPSWQKAMKAVRAASDKQSKALELAWKQLDAGKTGAIALVCDAMTADYLAARWLDRAKATPGILDHPPKDTSKTDLLRLRQATEDRMKSEDDGARAMSEKTKSLVADFKSAHPEWTGGN